MSFGIREPLAFGYLSRLGSTPNVRAHPPRGARGGQIQASPLFAETVCTCVLRWYPNRCRVHPERNQ